MSSTSMQNASEPAAIHTRETISGPEPMNIEQSNLFSTSAYMNNNTDHHQSVPFNSPRVRFVVDEEMHCLPLDISSQSIGHTSEDTGIFFHDRYLVEQMLSSTSHPSSSPRNAALEAGKGDYPMLLQAPVTDTAMQCDFEMIASNNNSCSSTYVDSPVTPPNQISPQPQTPLHSSTQSLLYHPQPRYFDAGFQIPCSSSPFQLRDPGSPSQFRSCRPLADSDYDIPVAVPHIDVLRRPRPRVMSGLGIYQTDAITSKEYRAPVRPAIASRKSKRPRDDDEDDSDGPIDRGKKHKKG